MQEVIIVGAGAAGVAAAELLSAQGVSVTLLEARHRAGGRIHTVQSAAREMPIELGAEFIHGSSNAAWDLVRAVRLQTHEVPDRHWQFRDGRLTENNAFWDELAEVLQNIPRNGRDHDVKSWLEQNSRVSKPVRQMIFDYTEGFHAAPAERMSLHALARASESAGRDEGERSFRVQRGYSEIIHWLLAQSLSRHVRLHLNSVVKVIRWEPGAAEIEVQTPGGTRLLQAARVLVTLPLGVLKNEAAGVLFDPWLEQKNDVVNGLEMGHVVKIALQFRSRFWPVENFGFIHSDDEWLPTWWADERGLVLTGWTAGPRAEWLIEEDQTSILSEAFRSLGRIFKMERDQLADLLVDSWQHDWTHDPFSCGAYSYTPVGNIDMTRRLGEPVENTLFFAGEATDWSGEQGTVHAAVASGKRAAGEILESFRAHHVTRQAGHLR